MPRMNGLEATQEIREHEREKETNKTPIVMVSGDGGELRKQECLEAGCDEYVMKPVEQNEMLALIQEYVVDA